jgi:hypothetical protein
VRRVKAPRLFGILCPFGIVWLCAIACLLGIARLFGITRLFGIAWLFGTAHVTDKHTDRTLCNISIQEGVYSINSPMGVGLKAGITRFIPFSIQTPAKVITQIMGRNSL